MISDEPVPSLRYPGAWQKWAKCYPDDLVGKPKETQEFADQFFPVRDKTTYETIATRAKNICNGKDGHPVCPVKMHCLLDAIDNDEPHGIFGGMSHRERNALVRRAANKGMTVREFLGVEDRDRISTTAR